MGTSSLLKWYHQESNRGHKDFQSFALPTELWHHRYCLFAGAKIGVFCDSRKFFRIFLEKNARVSENCSIFAPAIRDLAQLVAHYVRDVGVAGSSPVIPTVSGKRYKNFFPLLFFMCRLVAGVVALICHRG